MNPVEVIGKYRSGEITLSECWELLKTIRPVKARNEIVLTEPPKQEKQTINEHELKAIERLQTVSFGMSRSMKRFIHQIKDAQELTPRQREYLRSTVYRYRRQMWREPESKAKAFIEKMKGKPE